MSIEPIVWPDKRAFDELDYQIDWSDLGDDPIAAAVHSVPAGLTKGVDEKEEGFTPYSVGPPEVQNSTVVWLSGGEPGTTYEGTCRVTTVAGRSVERPWRLTVVG